MIFIQSERGFLILSNCTTLAQRLHLPHPFPRHLRVMLRILNSYAEAEERLLSTSPLRSFIYPCLDKHPILRSSSIACSNLSRSSRRIAFVQSYGFSFLFASHQIIQQSNIHQAARRIVLISLSEHVPRISYFSIAHQ